jgi:tetratricopeptide (TPR) repeat protein
MSLLVALIQESETQEADRQAKEAALISANAAAGQNPADADSWCHLGDALYQLNRYKQALGAYDRAVVLDAQKVTIWVNKGRTLLRLRHYEETVKACDRALALDPSIAEAWGNQAIALFSLARYQEAATVYEHACALNPDYGVDVDALRIRVHTSERGSTMLDDKPPEPRSM